MVSIKQGLGSNIILSITLCVFSACVLFLNFYCNLYIRPISDDFWRDTGPVTFPTYLDNLKEWYLLHNGRYANAVISLLPFLYSIAVYRILVLLLHVVFIFTIHLVLSRWLKIKNSFLIACSFLAFFLVANTAYYETFMWLASSGHYILGFCIFIALIFLLYNDASSHLVKYSVGASIVVLLVGFNEIWMIGVPFTLAMLLTRSLLKKEIFARNLLVFLFFLSLVCFAFSYLSPGNSVRSALFPESHQMLSSMIWSFIDFFQEAGRMLFGVFSPMFLVCQFMLLFFLLFIRRFNSGDESLKPIISHKWIIMLVLVGFIGITLFTVKYGMHYRTLGIGRVRNMRFIFMSALFLYLLIVLADQLKNKISTAVASASLSVVQLTISVSLVIFMYNTYTRANHASARLSGTLDVGNNAFELLYDFKNGRWKKYDEQWKDRISIVEKSKNLDVVFQPLNECPLTLENKITSYDIRTDSSSYFNKGLVAKYHLGSVRVAAN